MKRHQAVTNATFNGDETIIFSYVATGYVLLDNSQRQPIRGNDEKRAETGLNLLNLNEKLAETGLRRLLATGRTRKPCLKATSRQRFVPLVCIIDCVRPRPEIVQSGIFVKLHLCFWLVFNKRLLSLMGTMLVLVWIQCARFPFFVNSFSFGGMR
jgi:hypothetical protein